MKTRRVVPRQAISTMAPVAESWIAAARPSASSPRAVKNRVVSASLVSCVAATPPPPAASAKVSRAWTISPVTGIRSTTANSAHST